jgi:hypothetical protein
MLRVVGRNIRTDDHLARETKKSFEIQNRQTKS